MFGLPFVKVFGGKEQKEAERTPIPLQNFRQETKMASRENELLPHFLYLLLTNTDFVYHKREINITRFYDEF